MIILGVDAGKRLGLAVLDVAAGVADYRDRQDVTADDLAPEVTTLCATWRPDVLAIELPSQVFAHGRAKNNMGRRVGIERNLLVARGLGERLRGIVETLVPGIRVFDGQAHEIRKAVLGRMPRAPKATDASQWIDGIVRRRVPLLVRGWPKGAGDNDHNRDAAIAALWGERMARLPAVLRRTA